MEATLVSNQSLKCFICLQRCFEENTTGTAKLNCSDALRSLSRHVKLFKQTSPQGISETAMKLCSECSTLLSKFKQLFRILEEARLRVNHCVRQIVDVMKEADDDIRSGSPTAEYKTLLDPFRRNLLNQCEATLKLAQPFVALEKKHLLPIVKVEAIEPLEADSEELSAVEDIFNATDDFELPDPDEPEVPIKVEMSPFQNDCQNDLRETQSSPSKTAKKKKRPPRSPESSPSSQPKDWRAQMVKCSLCSRRFRQSSLRLHEAQEHREHYLLPHKLESVSQPKFKRIVDLVLFQDLLETLKCVQCGKEWPRMSHKYLPRTLSRHLIGSHLDFLCEKVVELQKDPSVLEKVEKLEVAPEDKPCGKVPCHLCGDSFHPNWIKRHVDNPLCRRTVLLKSKNPPPNSGPFSYGGTRNRSELRPLTSKGRSVACKKCGKRLQKRSLNFHEKYACKNGKRGRKQCSACNKYLHPESFHNHKKYWCKGLGPAREMGQKVTAFPCDNCNKSFENSFSLGRHQKYYCQANGDVRKMCPRCQKWMHPLSMKQHLKYASSCI